MLGRTHEVSAPTELLKVMESAVAAAGIPGGTRPQCCSMAFPTWTIHPWKVATRAGCSKRGGSRAPGKAPSCPPRPKVVKVLPC